MRWIILLTVLFALTPSQAFACSGILDCAFGWSDREEIRANRDVEQARIQAAADAERARIEGDALVAKAQANAEVERIKQAQWATEAQRDIAIAQAQQQATQYAAMIDGLTNEKLAGIQANADTQIAALQGQAQIAVAGILETGQTERMRIGFSWAALIIMLVLVAVVSLYWLRRHEGNVMVVSPHRPALGQREQLPWYSDSIEIVEVKNNVITRR